MTQLARRVVVISLFVIGCGCAKAAPPDTSTRRWTEPATGMVFTPIPAGDLLMGSPPQEPGREAQEHQHAVRVSKAFWLGIFEVTQREWQSVMATTPSHFRGGGERLPVENVTWFEVSDFLARLTKQSPGNIFRLPTEAEWEYACRAGTTSAYNTGASLSHTHANFAESVEESVAGKGRTTPVGFFPPNAWGLHDMHGNVWEWIQDEHCPYSNEKAIDPVGRCGNRLKVIRGGSWYFAADSARCGLRYTHRPQDRGFSLGFRVVRETG